MQRGGEDQMGVKSNGQGLKFDRKGKFFHAYNLNRPITTL